MLRRGFFLAPKSKSDRLNYANLRKYKIRGLRIFFPLEYLWLRGFQFFFIQT
jgi:hypothetical protein